MVFIMILFSLQILKTGASAVFREPVLVIDVLFADRMFVYGGTGIRGDTLASVEMLWPDGRAWQTLPTPMYKADSTFSSVALQ